MPHPRRRAAPNGRTPFQPAAGSRFARCIRVPHRVRFGRRTGTIGLAGLAVLALGLTACGPGTGGTPAAADGGKIKVVASTNVYADIVKEVGASWVDVTAVIDRPSQDPHSYEATARDTLAVSKADLVVENGGGYDEFMDRIVQDRGLDAGSVITAVDVSGLAAPIGTKADHEPDGTKPSGADPHVHAAGSFNEHVWYSLPAVVKIADSVADKLAAVDGSEAKAFRANAAAFGDRIAGLESKLAAVKAAHSGAGVAITEPVPLYLLSDAGLVNKTPPAFSEAVEAGTDVPVTTLVETEDLLTTNRVGLLAYNRQTEGPQTQKISDTAQRAGIPVVNFTETLPEGDTYVQWMSANIDAIRSALAK